MDKRIPPDPPTPVTQVQRENIELKIRQGMHREAFDSALQQAEHRRTMSDKDRLIAEKQKQADVAPAIRSYNSTSADTPQRVNALHLHSMLKQPGQYEKYEQEKRVDVAELVSDHFHNQLSAFESATTSTNLDVNMSSNRFLSTEAMVLLREKLQLSHCDPGESIAIELLDEPSGVAAIKLSKDVNNSWTIRLLVQSNEGFHSSDEAALSENLKHYLHRCDVAVAEVSVGLFAETSNNIQSSIAVDGNGI